MNEYVDSDLPTGQDILGKIRKLETANSDTLLEIKDWTFDKAEALSYLFQKFIVAFDFKEDPEVFQNRLLKYHNIVSGLIGLSSGMYDRAHKLEADNLRINQDPAVKKAMTATDKELHIKGVTAHFRALKISLEELEKNIEQRLFSTRVNRR